jgi:hypothetical protein
MSKSAGGEHVPRPGGLGHHRFFSAHPRPLFAVGR